MVEGLKMKRGELANVLQSARFKIEALEKDLKHLQEQAEHETAHQE